MAKKQLRSITKRTVDSLSVADKDEVFWDRDLPGFGVRVYPSGAKVFVVQCRGSGRSQRVTLGRYGLMTVEQARRQAALTIARIKNGEDLEPKAEPERDNGSTQTVATAADRYLNEHVAIHCRETSARMYKRLLNKVHPPRPWGCAGPRSHAAARAGPSPEVAAHPVSGEPGA